MWVKPKNSQKPWGFMMFHGDLPMICVSTMPCWIPAISGFGGSVNAAVECIFSMLGPPSHGTGENFV